MNHIITQGDILVHGVYEGHILATSDQDEHGHITTAIVKVRELASMCGAAVFAVDRIDGKNLEPVSVQILEDAGWKWAGRAVASHAVEVACGRGGENIVDSAGGGVQ